MATPLGHALAGYTVYRFSAAKGADRVHLIWLCVVLSIAPDLDFVPGILLGRPAMYHQGITHSLGFALMVSLTITMIYNLRGWPFSSVFKLSFFAYFSHLVLDFFGPDGRPPLRLTAVLAIEYGVLHLTSAPVIGGTSRPLGLCVNARVVRWHARPL